MIKDIKKLGYIIIGGIFSIIAIISTFSIWIKFNGLIDIYPELKQELLYISYIVLILLISVLCIMSIFYIYTRKEVINFTNTIVDLVDKIISEEQISFDITKDTLLSKIENKLKQLIEVLACKNKIYLQEKEAIKSLIGDISHQIKTPIASIAMYNDTLIERDLSKAKEKQFLKLMKGQVVKLEWLVEALLKMSKLETGVIKLNLKKNKLNNTIANALSGVYLKALKKNIEIKVNCDEGIELYHDGKWTTEALFNVIDNGVKYTEGSGEININVEQWELFTKIDIKDTGIGIKEEEINEIFKRFYRSYEVSDIEGVGVGLYLSREIITSQGGYIKVKSEKDKGTCFSIYMKN